MRGMHRLAVRILTLAASPEFKGIARPSGGMSKPSAFQAGRRGFESRLPLQSA